MPRFYGAVNHTLLEVNGGNFKKAIKELSEEAEKGSFWFWLRRKEQNWGENT